MKCIQIHPKKTTYFIDNFRPATTSLRHLSSAQKLLHVLLNEGIHFEQFNLVHDQSEEATSASQHFIYC
jgi:hypothetical protein